MFDMNVMAEAGHFIREAIDAGNDFDAIMDGRVKWLEGEFGLTNKQAVFAVFLVASIFSVRDDKARIVILAAMNQLVAVINEANDFDSPEIE